MTWGTAAGKNVADSAVEVAAQSSLSVSRPEGMVSDTSLEKLVVPNGADPSRVSTPDLSLADDPGRFESEKQRKTSLQEGLKKFNYKPKKVCRKAWKRYVSHLAL